MTEHEQSVLVVAHTTAQAEYLSRELGRNGVATEVFATVAAASVAAGRGVGALLIDQECLDPAALSVLREIARNQPSWSDLPFIILAPSERDTAFAEGAEANLKPLRNAILLQRPLSSLTLISTIGYALRCRSRQYQVRENSHQRLRYEDTLRQSEKLAVMGRLAASIVHEINNPLEAVTNLLYLANQSESLSESKHYTLMAQGELARVSEITLHTLRFSRQQSTPDMTDLCDLLRSVLTLHLARVAAANIKVDSQLDGNHKLVAHPGELRQLFANLIGNALDAMPSGGRLSLRIRQAREHRHPGRRGLRVLVSDSGCGIPHPVRHTIFEPFVSTKGAAGTGLGLWVSNGIVQRHGGSIRFRSSTHPQSSGTTFAVFLPYEPYAAAAREVAS